MNLSNIISVFSQHIFFKILIYAVLMDTFLGVLRAIKERKFNSSAGIDGAIRKVGMLFSVMFLMIVDSIIQIDFLFMIPDKYLQYIGMTHLGICGLFCILFIIYEFVSVMKNMALCGMPIPTKVKEWLVKFLDDMTEELPDSVTDMLHEETSATETKEGGE